ncbi:MAG: 16S rRNA (cytidine(1402)-2'-O)-methyltransferase [Kiritimatiellae bacterium]|nr:16S rRNA (cytidine(1402)-2'-O)-methyltransferase [Kiritimatiellia bacterium]
MQGGLYIVGTPIGNLGDITFRAVETLKAADVILAEDTRHTRKLLARYDIHVPLVSCHRFNEAARVERALEAIRAGKALALVTDSGMPGISDPGSRVVAACRAAGFPVTAVPGPTAVATAVALSGMGGRGYLFEGFLPHKSGARRRRLGELAAEEHPVVLFESPYRLLKLLTEIEEVMGPRRVFVGRELTKQFEECLEGAPADVRAAFAGRTVKGEQVVVIAPAERGAEPLPCSTA